MNVKDDYKELGHVGVGNAFQTTKDDKTLTCMAIQGECWPSLAYVDLATGQVYTGSATKKVRPCPNVELRFTD